MEDYELKPAPGNPDRVRPSITARLKEGTRAVSYTHLDVYKRQDKGQFEEKLNQSIRQYHPEYWRARLSGREAAEAARSTAPAKEAAR